MVFEAREYRKSIPHIDFHPYTWYQIIFWMDICCFMAKTCIKMTSKFNQKSLMLALGKI